MERKQLIMVSKVGSEVHSASVLFPVDVFVSNLLSVNMWQKHDGN